jgi:Family of unknown function (DUF6390)
MSTPGPVLFARFAYPPNALGYCGPEDSATLFGHAGLWQQDATPAGLAAGPAAELGALARRFEGAWPYLALIAAANRRPDPLDDAVVEAYWIGGPLLERVPAGLFANHLEQRFRSRIGGREFPDLAELAVRGGRAHHNFHVFAVYPWIGMLRAGPVAQPLQVLDACRVRWGRLLSVSDGKATVLSRPLRWTGSALRLGPARIEVATLAGVRGGLAPAVRPGDTVALHWDWVCDVLTTAQARTLCRYTVMTLALVNRALDRPVPALAIEPVRHARPATVM